MGLADLLAQFGGMSQNPQLGVLASLGLGGQNYTLPIGPQQGTGSPLDSQSITDQMRNSSLVNLANKLGTWGAGVSRASGPSRLPVDFGQALAGGTDALNADEDRQLSQAKTLTEIGALGAKGQPDLEAQAQQALMKYNMGQPLTPEEIAALKTYSSLNEAKQSTYGLPSGGYVSAPSYRSIVPPGLGGQGNGQRPRTAPSRNNDPMAEFKELEARRRAAGIQ